MWNKLQTVHCDGLLPLVSSNLISVDLAFEMLAADQKAIKKKKKCDPFDRNWIILRLLSARLTSNSPPLRNGNGKDGCAAGHWQQRRVENKHESKNRDPGLTGGRVWISAAISKHYRAAVWCFRSPSTAWNKTSNAVRAEEEKERWEGSLNISTISFHSKWNHRKLKWKSRWGQGGSIRDAVSCVFYWDVSPHWCQTLPPERDRI